VANPFGARHFLHWYDQWPPSFEEEETPAEEEKAIAPVGYASPFTVYDFETDGFVLFSSFAPVDGPYLTSWVDEYRNVGDPPLPGGLPVGGGGTVPQSVPEPGPGTMFLLGLGVFVVIGFVKRRRAA